MDPGARWSRRWFARLPSAASPVQPGRWRPPLHADCYIRRLAAKGASPRRVPLTKREEEEQLEELGPGSGTAGGTRERPQSPPRERAWPAGWRGSAEAKAQWRLRVRPQRSWRFLISAVAPDPIAPSWLLLPTPFFGICPGVGKSYSSTVYTKLPRSLARCTRDDPYGQHLANHARLDVLAECCWH